MSYQLRFNKSALKEWRKLNLSVREQFKNKLHKRLQNPKIQSAKVNRAANTYKIKLRQLGYRLVYSVHDETITVVVIAVGKRNKNSVYDLALSRINKQK